MRQQPAPIDDGDAQLSRRPKRLSDGFDNNGIFQGNAAVRIADITDGTSNTFAVGERDERCRAGTWIGCRNPPGPDMWGSYFVRGRVSIKLNDPRATAPNRCTEGFSSKHPGGALFSLCDGSTRFVSNTINFSNGGLSESQITNKRPSLPTGSLGIYQLLGIRNDGHPGRPTAFGCNRRIRVIRRGAILRRNGSKRSLRVALRPRPTRRRDRPAHRVQISTARIIRENDQKIAVPEKVPATYNENSTLTREVQRGSQTIDFALERQ